MILLFCASKYVEMKWVLRLTQVETFYPPIHSLFILHQTKANTNTTLNNNNNKSLYGIFYFYVADIDHWLYANFFLNYKSFKNRH